MPPEPGTRYHQIAEALRASLINGVYQAGERLPSLRQICREYRVSLGTAVEAYGQLQDEGWVASRNRAGFFALPPPGTRLPPPRMPRLSSTPTAVSISQITLKVVGNLRKPGMVNLGAGMPGTAMLSVKNLARSLSGAARRHGELLGYYVDIMGELPLRRQIARMMTLAGVASSPEEILITNGCQEALHLALQCVAEPGDTIAVESPTFFGLLQAAEALHLKVVEMPIAYPGGVPPRAVREVAERYPIKACLFTPSFNNPMGVVMPDADKREIVAFLAEKRIALIEDDIIGFLSFDAPRPRAARSFDTTGNTLLCSSFSKTLAPGMRVGWLHTGRWTEAARNRKFLANITTAPVPQLAIASFLKREAFQREMRVLSARLSRQMRHMTRDIQTYFPRGTRITDPQGGLYLWLELPDGLDSQVLYHRSLEQGISLLPGRLFSTGGHFRSHIRLTFATESTEVTREAIKKIAALLPGLPTAPAR